MQTLFNIYLVIVLLNISCMFVLLIHKIKNMAKLKLRKGTKYPFKWLDKVGAKFTVTDANKKNVNAAYAMYKAKNEIQCDIEEYTNGTIIVTRIL